MPIFVEPVSGDQFTVEGGRPIQGEIRPAGNKNEALPVIAASLLVSGPVVLENLPRIGDVETLLEAVRRLGAEGGRHTPYPAERLRRGRGITRGPEIRAA